MAARCWRHRHRRTISRRTRRYNGSLPIRIREFCRQGWIVAGLCLIAGFLAVVGGFVLFVRPQFGANARKPGNIYQRMSQ